jgi:sensor domain CHASE-containing protein
MAVDSVYSSLGRARRIGEIPINRPTNHNQGVRGMIFSVGGTTKPDKQKPKPGSRGK